MTPRDPTREEKMSDDCTIKQAVKEAIGECAGFVSLCWEPKPTGVFDSTLAAGAVDAAVTRAHSAMQEERAAGYAAGLDAAREAVEAVENDPDAEVDYDRDYAADPTGNCRNPRIWLRSALAAIDALRGDRGDASRCVSCGAWTENHLVCYVCEEPVHPQLCPWKLRGYPACMCTETEQQLAAYGYFRGRQSAHA